ncbi:hypothetical protein RFI_33847 [Reticulomyxa filosa]|uniref:Uncharacterized protein n=1 Tax=Reticulomyxa filosa TaxID=46433 RepID=X6LQ87_RETFI|nr:hypothetical protein RFI_33847 [Reticulomyxa filosa]|eukprot:ETO03556.1 hypothetical protein RFI_33847 [Reticulomyxa filosa]
MLNVFEIICVEQDILLRWIQKLDYLPLLQLQLQVYDKAKPRKDYLKQVVALADELIGQINTTAVAAAFFGRKAMEKEDSEYKKLAKKCNEEKVIVIDALTDDDRRGEESEQEEELAEST